MGTVHARQYAKMADVELAIFDHNSERLAEFGAQTGGVVVGSRDELVSWADVIDVCLPTDLHADACLAAIAAGRAVFCEKPLALDLASGSAVVAAADKANVQFMPGQVVRFFPEFARGHRMVKDGAVGNPAVARTRRGGGAPFGSDGWFMDPTRSGGVLLDLAIHDFDWLRWTLGEVTQVRARKTGTGEGPEYALTVLTFESGCLGHVEATWMDPGGFRTTFEVAGSGGLIEFDSRTAPSVRVSTMGSTSVENPLASTDDPYYQELRQFLDAVSAGTTPPVTGLDGLHALAIAVAANESAETDRTVRPASQF
jgi:predicted dehydrogenase